MICLSSREYRTIVSCTQLLETAFKPPDRNIVHFLHREGFVTQEVHDDVLNPRSILNDHQKAGELVAGIRSQVKLSAKKYHKLINFLRDTGKQCESIVEILDKEYKQQEQGRYQS